MFVVPNFRLTMIRLLNFESHCSLILCAIWLLNVRLFLSRMADPLGLFKIRSRLVRCHSFFVIDCGQSIWAFALQRRRRSSLSVNNPHSRCLFIAKLDQTRYWPKYLVRSRIFIFRRTLIWNNRLVVLIRSCSTQRHFLLPGSASDRFRHYRLFALSWPFGRDAVVALWAS